MLGAALSRGVRVSIALLSALAVACGAMNVGAPQALAEDSFPTMTAEAVAPVPGRPKIKDNREVSKENLKDAVVKVQLKGLEPGKRYSLEAVTYDAHDPEDSHVWDEEDNPMHFTPPRSWQSSNAVPSYPFQLIIEQPLDFTAKSTNESKEVKIGDSLKMFTSFDETLNLLVNHGKFVVVTRLREFQTHDPSKPINQTRRELQMSPVVAVTPERNDSKDVIEGMTLNAVHELALPEETTPSSTEETTSAPAEETTSSVAEETTPSSTTSSSTPSTSSSSTTSEKEISKADTESTEKEPVAPVSPTSSTTPNTSDDENPSDEPGGSDVSAEDANKGSGNENPKDEATGNEGSESDTSAGDSVKNDVTSAEVYAKDENGNITHELTPENASTAVQHLEVNGLEPGEDYSLQTVMRVDDVDGDYITDESGKQPMMFSTDSITADDSGKVAVDVPLSNLADEDFEVPFAEGQDTLKAVVQNKLVSEETDDDTTSPTEILTYPNASTPAAEVEKQTLSFSRDAWEETSRDMNLNSLDTDATSETSSATKAANPAGGASSSELPGKQDTASSSTQSEKDSLAKKLSNGTKVMPGGDVAPGSPAQNVGKSQNSTVTADSKNVSLNPPPKDNGVTIQSDAGIVGGKLTKGAVVVDNVSFTGLRPDSDYALKGELICSTTGESTGAANSITFRTPKSDKPTVDGSTVLSIPVLSDDCAEQIVVETLYDAVSVDKDTLEAGSMVATTAGSAPTTGSTVKDGKSTTPAVVTQQVQPAKGATTQATSSVRVIRSVNSPSTVTSTGSVRQEVGAALSPQAQRVVVSNLPSGPVGLPAQSAPYIE